MENKYKVGNQLGYFPRRQKPLFIVEVLEEPTRTHIFKGKVIWTNEINLYEVGHTSDSWTANPIHGASWKIMNE